MYKKDSDLYSRPMVKFTVSEARAKLAQVVALSRRRPVVLERHGEEVAVLISPERYERMLEALEELEDQEAFDAALAEAGASVSWDEARADLGWS